MTTQEFLAHAVAAAVAGEHIWPDYAACEAALESGWGKSELAQVANNLFGQKQGFTTGGVDSIEIPTHEFLQGEYVTVMARWPKFSSWADCFRARMSLLRSKSDYAPALASTTGQDFIRAVSKVWATDPLRADKVLAIYRSHMHDIAGAVARVGESGEMA